jgi:hypothetical protein
LVVFASPANATTAICEEERSSQSEKQLVVRVPDERYAEFVQLIESGDIVPVAKRMKHTGGVESKRSIWWALQDSSYSVGVYADYFKRSKEFVFWVQTCNTTDTWQPYWRALNARVRAFPDAEVEERAYPNQ